MPVPAFVPAPPYLRRTPAPFPPVRSRPRPRPLPARRRRAEVRAATADYYEVLGLPRDAAPSAVKRAYRRAALQNHPDVSSAPDAKERFLRVQEAYNVLSDPAQRAAYDRRTRVGAGPAWQQPAPGPAFDPDEYLRRWRQRNPMPDDLNDSFGSIFSDLFSGVADAVGSGSRDGSREGSLMDDFVEFLEKQVDGFGVNASGYASDDNDGLDDILRTSDVDVLQAEIDDARFVLQQLRTRRTKLEEEETALSKRAEEWRSRADRAYRSKDYMARDAARDRERDLRAEAKRFSVRARKTQSHIDKQQDRLKKIQRRLDDVRKQGTGTEARGPTPDSKATDKSAIDDELERMKKELGL